MATKKNIVFQGEHIRVVCSKESYNTAIRTYVVEDADGKDSLDVTRWRKVAEVCEDKGQIGRATRDHQIVEQFTSHRGFFELLAKLDHLTIQNKSLVEEVANLKNEPVAHAASS